MNNIKKRILFSILITILVGMACTLGLILYANPIMELFFSNASKGDLLLKISSISIIFISIEQTINGALQGLGKVNVPLKALFTGVVIKLILNIILLKLNPNKYIIGGIIGATIATIISHIFSTFISFKELKRCLKIKISINKFFLKPIIINLLMGIVSFGLYNFLLGIFSKNFAIILVILISMLIYIIFLFIFKIFDKEELYMIPYYYKIEERLANKRIQRNNIKINNQWK